MNKPVKQNTLFTGKNKPVIIAVVAIVLVVVIVLIGRQLVGKAIYVPLPAGFTAGAEFPVDLPKRAGDIATITVSTKFEPAWESVAYSFELQYDPAILEFVDVDSKLAGDWGTDFVRQGITPDAAGLKTLKFEHATIDFASAIDVTEAQLVRLADVNFKVLKPEINTFLELGTLQFTNIDVISLDAAPIDYTGSWQYVQPTGLLIITNAAGRQWFRSAVGVSDAEGFIQLTLCQEAGLTDADCPVSGAAGPNADLNKDSLIDDRDVVFILQAIEAKQSAYGFCGATGQPPCVFGDRAICEDVSYEWSDDAGLVSPPSLPTQESSTSLSDCSCGDEDICPPKAAIELSATGPADIPIPAEFSIAGTSDLLVYLYFQRVPEGAALAWVEFMNPAGARYLLDTEGYAVGQTDVRQLTAPDGQTVFVYDTVSTNKGYRYEYVLSIAGTNIQSFSLVGLWTVKVYAEDPATGASSIGETTFTLVE